MVPLSFYLALSATLFFIGAFSFLTRRNLIMMFISIEIMLNSVNISLVAFSHYMQDIRGQILALFVIAIAGGAVAVGLIILVLAYRNKKTLKLEEFKLLREE
ncbi:NADH-quinone oxidoreductase subunit NuoK [Thermodesulfovibrio yellowstonii]|uniref:NADH-quinone oxidoreductase subunit K n=1 Tax=Thermodesulfovibrio yellowstonii TaxID=28262 RepID=A0A9W6GGD7_9BACT|nr:NADH-quinone oxidoreductase subunit NuoK [Thermodesulfovibrio islandicus]GLI53665.1 NADH-quinone oxidoreductase subunit K [Thermodesulfovibrio islandicus]